jgi:hypothetical protein
MTEDTAQEVLNIHASTGFHDSESTGVKPGNLPVEQTIKFDLIINLNTAGHLR